MNKLKLLSLPIALFATGTLVTTISCSQKGLDPIPAHLFDIVVPTGGIILSPNKSIDVTITCSQTDAHVLKNIKLIHNSQELSTISGDKNMSDGKCNLTFNNITLLQTINDAIIQFNYDSVPDKQEIKRITINVNQPTPVEPTFSIQSGATMTDEINTTITLKWECDDQIFIQNDQALTFKYDSDSKVAKATLSSSNDKSQQIKLLFDCEHPVWEDITDGCLIFNYKNQTTEQTHFAFIKNILIKKYVPTSETTNFNFTVNDDLHTASITGIPTITVETINIPGYVYKKINGEIKNYMVVSIGDNAFDGKTVLKTVILSSTIKLIGKQAFMRCEKLENITVPESVYQIGDEAFSGCSSLKTFAWPKNTKKIGKLMFYQCFLLQSITIPKEVTSIGEQCFNECINLHAVTFPEESKLSLIDNNAFLKTGSAGVPYFTLILSYTNSEHIVTAGEYIFGNESIKYSFNKIYVPKNLQQQYKAAENWSAYASIIEVLPIQPK